ncbi:MAG: hypothetical protein ABR520_02150, partial [Mycobacteriales bacterium]
MPGGVHRAFPRGRLATILGVSGSLVAGSFAFPTAAQAAPRALRAPLTVRAGAGWLARVDLPCLADVDPRAAVDLIVVTAEADGTLTLSPPSAAAPAPVAAPPVDVPDCSAPLTNAVAALPEIVAPDPNDDGLLPTLPDVPPAVAAPVLPGPAAVADAGPPADVTPAAPPVTTPAAAVVAASPVPAPPPLTARAAQAASGLTLSKRVSATRASYGDVLTYSLTAGTTGPLPQTRVVVTDAIPPTLRYVIGSARCSNRCSILYDRVSRSLRWTLGTLAGGSRVSLSFRATLVRTGTGPLPATTVSNVAVIRSDQATPARSNAARTAVGAVSGVGSGVSGLAPLTPGTAPSAAPRTDTSPQPVIAPPPGAPRPAGSTLAKTGSSTTAVALLALTMIVVGAGLVSAAGRMTAALARAGPPDRVASPVARSSP